MRMATAVQPRDLCGRWSRLRAKVQGMCCAQNINFKYVPGTRVTRISSHVHTTTSHPHLKSDLRYLYVLFRYKMVCVFCSYHETLSDKASRSYDTHLLKCTHTFLYCSIYHSGVRCCVQRQRLEGLEKGVKIKYSLLKNAKNAE